METKAFVGSKESYLVDTGRAGIPLVEVNELLKSSQWGNILPCIYCGNTSKYKIIPKHPEYDTALIQDKGYVCENCLATGKLDKKNYGIRPL